LNIFIRTFWGNERPSSSDSEDSENDNRTTNSETQVIIISILSFCFESMQRQLKVQKNLFDEQVNELKIESQEHEREKRKYISDVLKTNYRLVKTKEKLIEIQNILGESRKELRETKKKLTEKQRLLIESQEKLGITEKMLKDQVEQFHLLMKSKLLS